MLYDYECRTCGHSFEASSSVASRNEMACEECGAPATRLFTLAPLEFTPVIHEFVEHNFGPSPVLVRGRTHKRELLKEKGLIQTG